MSLSVPFLRRTTGLEKSGDTAAVRAALVIRGLVVMGALLMANPSIVSPGDVTGKLSFVQKKPFIDDFHFAWNMGKA
jgi:hypothetical protein